MKKFEGFQTQKNHLVPIPEDFFGKIFPYITHLGELKVTLYAFWFLEKQEGQLKFIRFTDFWEDKPFLSGLGTTTAMIEKNLIEGLNLAVERGTFLTPQTENEKIKEAIFFLNTPRGRAAFTALEHGAWSPQEKMKSIVRPKVERPNIFQLYESNIGPLTPMMAEILQEAEDTYSPQWLEDAVRIAVENNARSWRYVEAILKSWEERGRDEKDRRDTQQDPNKYIDGEFGKFVNY